MTFIFRKPNIYSHNLKSPALSYIAPSPGAWSAKYRYDKLTGICNRRRSRKERIVH